MKRVVFLTPKLQVASFMKLFLAFSFAVLLHHTHAQQFYGNKADIDQILANSNAFSKAYVNSDYEGMMNFYTTDGKIMPTGTAIIEGHENIQARWVLPEGDKVVRHVASPTEIRIIENYAYDFGYYEGETLKANGEKLRWKGKYVIVWRKDESTWRMYLDIWNRVN